MASFLRTNSFEGASTIALDLFDDNYFDFVYIDGYAHTGEEGGKTLADSLPKVKIGGVIAGDDYHEKWPLVKAAVNRFIDDTGFELMLTQTVEDDVKFSNYPSWACIKSREIDIEPDKSLEMRGKLAGTWVGFRRNIKYRLHRQRKVSPNR